MNRRRALEEMLSNQQEWVVPPVSIQVVLKGVENGPVGNNILSLANCYTDPGADASLPVKIVIIISYSILHKIKVLTFDLMFRRRVTV
jgi:hypothetical protein